MRRPRAVRRLLAVLFPERCAYCGQVVRCGEGCCPCCAESLPRILPPVCPLCGRGKASCTCRGHRGPLDGLAAPFTYEGAVRQGILRLKEEGDATAATTLAAEMADAARRAWPEAAPELAVPVPVTRRKRTRKGFNQAALLAESLARELNIPCVKALVKCRETRPQKELAAWQRSGNLLGAFDVRPGTPLAGKCVLLVDDVSTTGATLEECAKMLKIQGAAQVLGIAAALTPGKKEAACQKRESDI